MKNIKKGAAWQTQYWWHVFEKKVPYEIYTIQENITNSLFGQKKSNLMENLKANAFFQFVWGLKFGLQ